MFCSAQISVGHGHVGGGSAWPGQNKRGSEGALSCFCRCGLLAPLPNRRHRQARSTPRPPRSRCALQVQRDERKLRRPNTPRHRRSGDRFCCFFCGRSPCRSVARNRQQGPGPAGAPFRAAAFAQRPLHSRVTLSEPVVARTRGCRSIAPPVHLPLSPPPFA